MKIGHNIQPVCKSGNNLFKLKSVGFDHWPWCLFADIIHVYCTTLKL